MDQLRYYTFRPLVSKKMHYLTNGLIWFFAGINLVRIAIGWYRESDNLEVLLGVGFTVIFAIIISQTRFKIISGKFNKHIQRLPDKSWFFAFQQFRHYVLLLLMMNLGILLKEYSGLNNYTLALIYTTMGSTLVLTSYFFFIQIINPTRTKPLETLE
ncbi:MAG: hypothetical protein HeimC2_02160 [Candidatus Heimdallarchaeota archaeon LC_2]|nr:MAG: hypothetical protein HeimC2_02160 [Candidatus Heimdallarchaeota archaeon LC_2]